MNIFKKFLVKVKLTKAIKEESQKFDKEVQKLLPAPKTKNLFDIEAEVLDALNKDKNSSISAIEAQMQRISDLIYKETSKKVVMFNPTLTEKRNKRLDEPELSTYEGTKKVLQELTIYNTEFKSQFKRFHVNYNSGDKNPLYWEA